MKRTVKEVYQDFLLDHPVAFMLDAHKTKITGFLLVVLGAVQAASVHLQAIFSPFVFAAIMAVVGVLVAIIGFLNSTWEDDNGQDSGV